jgi:adenylosuccinate synthase
MNTIVVGCQFGDEGKGKISDQLMLSHDICVRYSGGPNTGASVWADNKQYKFHLIPVGIIQNKHCYLGSQMYIDPTILQKEINTFQDLGYDVQNLLHISPEATIITQDHINQDCENEKENKGVGSTKRGMSPCASGKYARKSIKCGDLLTFNRYLCDISVVLTREIKNGKSILFESSQGALLDVDHGFYPYVSTTNNLAAAACVSCGLSPRYIDKIVGVVKPYMTKVGSGPFPTKIDSNNPLYDKLIEVGGEYGTTTGRKRDVGYLDLVLLEHAARVNGITEIALTKADVLEEVCFNRGLPFKACHSYSTKGPMESEILIDKVPTIKKNIKDCIPVYDLYYNINEIIKDIEGVTGVKVTYVSRSKNRD